MLATLFRNRNIERILLFLLVNETLWATQIQRIFNIPISPIQSALKRLEEDGILISNLKGNQRLYQFSPSYLLLPELQFLLKKAYSLLTPSDKKNYLYVALAPHRTKSSAKDHLLRVWQKMQTISTVILEFRKDNRSYGHGEGLIEITKDEEGALIFNEKGKWKSLKGESFDFNNCFRWRLNHFEGLLSLEHLRFGPQNPVFLFHLALKGPSYFESIDAHLCDEDTYFGALTQKNKSVHLNWRILGPKKNEEIAFVYS